MKKTLAHCINCGIKFEVKYKNHQYCSNQCMLEAREKRRAAYYRMYEGCVEDYTGSNIYMNEEKRGSKPLESDINETMALLKGFGINVRKVPDFDSHLDLEQWKRVKIKDALS